MANNTISLRSLLEKEKLNGINFLDWFRNLRIVLKQERKEYFIEEPVPNDPGANASRADKDKFKKHVDDMVDVGCLMLATMTPELQKQHEGLHMRRNLAKGDVDLRVGNGVRVAALAVGTYVLSLPSGLVLNLENCYFVPRKMTKAPFSGKGERASDLLGLIHSDVCGPMNTQARGGFQYFITFTDDFSRYGYIYLIRHKSEAVERFKEFKNEVQNQHGKSIKALRLDRGGEYLSQDFDELLKECGIVSQLTPPGTPQWNGVSERRNRTLLDMVRSMMSHTELPTSFWGYALETAAFTVNRVPSKSVQKTPHEM
ncbi:hypothetical protein V6N12_045113 [Hibiscus sabdariffa]|uniref:Integrase catalytic domain-containing protein n=1 Tax=Hibiscus sabdariffa TaxID=183260 RepID=A0ABR2G1U4_9ROSI